ncbi:CYTH domain-containing protein [Acetitomaculum ruminis DSM 5522]|uniref:CYTH domain-containing protein n=1 Tax=Acetitomaculum ruminis DSM 5522 TaxID=1120918 RepID=A0A1I0XC32_9FIRM|nr:CYTH domain-containing protein [Acetitomaculum ruminis]SFA98585.1 CYTH domain-containing protein [Acetitomaculum ruminis DSM 5522]
MEIERKFLVKKIPYNLNDDKNITCLEIEQAYLCTGPVVRIRRENHNYYLTYKGGGKMVREEYNLPLNKEAYEHLLAKADGHVITKNRYVIPIENNLKIELDVFKGPHFPIILAEVEFGSVEEANAFVPPSWFKKDVTMDNKYHNSNMALDFDLSKYKDDFSI